VQRSERSFCLLLSSVLFLLTVCGIPAFGQTNATPLINLPLVPDATAPGSSGFTLTVNGTGFVSGSTVYWNGAALPTTFVSASQLTATVSSSEVATAGTSSVTVFNPAGGGGTSGPALFQIAPSLAGLDMVATPTTLTEPPTWLAAGDFNGDGNLDVFAINADGTHGGNSNGSVFLGNGNGTFQPGVDYEVGKTKSSSPRQVITADFNNDGKLDVAIADSGDNGIAIMLGNGDGTFQTFTEYAAGLGVGGLTAGDFNGDGKLDLAAFDTGTGAVAILLGNGDGTFQKDQTYGTTGQDPYSIAAGDFNRDGKLDLAVADKTAVAVMLGDGDGTFQKAVKYKSPFANGAMATADFNADGKLDLALTGQAIGGTPALAVLLGDGDGTFQSYKEYAAGGLGASGIALGDFNADGKLDVATAMDSGSADVFLGNGDGTFQKSRSFAASSGPESIVAGDFNNDGFLDVAVGNFAATGALSVALGTVAPVASVSPASIAFGDVTLGQVSPTEHVTVTNTGSATLDITSVALSGSTEFGDTNSCPSSLLPAATCSVGVAFKASVGGDVLGTLTIADSAAGSPQTVTLTATATPVALSPSTLSFGSFKVGTSSPPQIITLTNVRNTPLEIFRVFLFGSNAGSFSETNTCPTNSTLAAGGSCTITVTFTPQATGSLSTDVEVQYEATGSPGTVPLSGTGTSN
jgi:hypothetical protein